MLRTRRSLLVLVVLAAFIAAPALTVTASPARAPAPSWLAWLSDWLPGAFGRADAADETYPNADPDGAQAYPNADPDGAQASESPGSGGEAYPNADPNG